jgi:hypothetical protein
VVLDVFGQIDRRHAARAKLALDAVTIFKCNGETIYGISHGSAYRPAARGSIGSIAGKR